MAEILNPQPGQVILEPSAGNGALCKAVKEISPETFVFACELYEEWRTDLLTVADVVVIKDFLEYPTNPKHSGCIANPPFGNEIDLKAHIDRMRHAVKIGGRMVILVPEDFILGFPHDSFSLENWSKNSDGTTTPIKIISFTNFH